MRILESWVVHVDGGRNKYRCKAECGCGDVSEYNTSNVKRGNTTRCKSCASKSRGGKRKTHGCSMSFKDRDPERHSMYCVWQAMKSRCNNVNHKSYKDYGGRGVSVCDAWLYSFETFLEDMGVKPTSRHQIDRIDNNKGYSPSNCRWATITENARNKRDTVMLVIDGVKKPMVEWAEQVSTATKTIEARLKRGWAHERAVFGTRHGKRYTTPEGEFKTLLEVQEVYNMSSSGVHSRFKSNKFPDWTIKEGK